MKGFILVALCLFIFALPLLAQDESVLAHYGTLKVGGILQSTFTYNLDTTAIQTSFALKRARLLFWGTILSDKVKYFIQTEGVGSPYVLDTKLIFTNYISMTSIIVGRFLPNFTHYMPRSTAKLDLINYPLIVSNYAMWRQCGFQTATKTDYVDFNLGVFNGYPKNNWSDDNDAKDALVAVTVKPVEFVKFIGYGWFGNMLLADTTDLAKNRYGGGAIFTKPLNEQMSVTFKGEYCMGSDETAPDTTQSSAGYYAHVGFKLNPQIELLVRYENFDPNTDGNVTGDAVTWITGGVNYFIDGDHAKVSVNYIKKQEETNEVQNDQFITQFQIFF